MRNTVFALLLLCCCHGAHAAGGIDIVLDVKAPADIRDEVRSQLRRRIAQVPGIRVVNSATQAIAVVSLELLPIKIDARRLGYSITGSVNSTGDMKALQGTLLGMALSVPTLYPLCKFIDQLSQQNTLRTVEFHAVGDDDEIDAALDALASGTRKVVDQHLLILKGTVELLASTPQNQ
jgi:hypothetical protein